MEPATATLLETSKAFSESLSKLDILEALKKKLVSQPNVAATKLSGALAELVKSILAFDAHEAFLPASWRALSEE
ncbi:hypothetical protein DR61_1373 [Burkholderia pseudomallei]|uniref:Uncharacterized protein n=1 Tax=Burkholderia pseudomallei 1710a TaxID=320371 RepID=A0A0E1VZ11_BURPE|nr:hypothetical protein [Burkholderia pseudomallei]AIS46909.1 hypothetical protein DR61_1373 [Burkholderia pseudomallei]EET06133.1 hypothetical protein BURPS1710A_1914 [Burkholderia pseudomallei 1710a]KGD19787.1 hypothetical protein DR60_4441 [Burkholderia pseudomallei]OMR47641.1 hypothetical protein AQ723_27910 [Burkholderia pseudomallei]OMT95854.1 hypothetical protein AQ768_01125 [Burkholderia pseudomallei]